MGSWQMLRIEGYVGLSVETLMQTSLLDRNVVRLFALLR